MFQRLWRSIQQLWQRWFGRKQKAQPEVMRSSVSSLPDKDYESVLHELLDRLTAENWGRGDVLGFLFARSISEAELAAWLPRFGDRFLESDEPDLEFAQKLVRLGAIGGQLGTVAEAIGRRELGRQNFAEAEEGAAHLDSIEQARFWSERGRQQAITGDFEGAIESYDRAMQINPDDYNTWYNRGVALSRLEQYEQAIASYDRAVQINPDDYEAWHNRGLTLSKVERHEEEIASYDRAVQIKPDFHDAWYNRGTALLQLERCEQAIESYDRALWIKPDKHDAWWGRGIAAGRSRRCTTTVLLSLPPAMQKFALDERGYEGELNTYYEGLKYVRREAQPEGWGKLHKLIGETHYCRGRFQPDADRYFRKAIQSYRTALETLTPEAFPEAYLEVMLDLIRAERGLENAEAVKQHSEQGLRVLQDLLNQASPLRKRQLELKFSGFRPFTVDRLIAENQLELALREAERNKNRCLSWILDEWQEPQWIPEYAEMQQLLNESTAIVYWHHSPSQITTFILKHDRPPEILAIDGQQQLRQFEDWLKGWNEDYRDYRSLKKTNRSPARKSHPWRTRLTTRLDELKVILGIPAIESQLPQAVQHLILVPHRDLHRLPLHALLSDRFTVTYLPSLQIGLSLQTHPEVRIDRQTPLLSVEDPARTDTLPLKFAELESAVIAQLFEAVHRLSDEEATETQVIAALQANPTQQIFHFTGHAEYNDRQPQYSSLGLTGSDRLTAQTIIRDLDLSRFSLICLSACETSITGMATIDSEYVGLPSALLQKGVTLVLSTLWTVDEITNAWMMIRFYQEILAGKPPALALQQAQQWLQTVDRPTLAQWLLNLSQTADLSAGIRERLRQSAAIVQTSSTEDSPEDSSTIGVSLPPYDPYHWAGFTLIGKGIL